MRRPHADYGEPGTQSSFSSWAPTDLLPGRRRQPEGELLYRNGLMVCTALQALGGCTPTRFSCWCWQGLLPRFPDCGIRLNAHHVLQPELREIRAKLRALSITRICQHHSDGNLLFHRLPNLF